MTKRKKETLKKILEKNLGFGNKIKVINIFNLDQGSSGETFNAIIECQNEKTIYELLHLYRHRDIIIRNYKTIKE